MIKTTLGEICGQRGGLIQTGPFGSQLHQSDYSDSGVPVVMPKDIYDGRVIVDGIARIPETMASQLSRHKLPVNSILMPRRGEIAKRALIQEDQAGFLCGTGCIQIVVPEKVLHHRYLYYFLAQRHVIEWLERNAIGTTMLNLNTKIIGGITIPLIPVHEQIRIADILSTYDDLIENNRRRIQLLEQSARLLYKEWFVHLRFPGHEHVKIKDGVPEGWTMVATPEIMQINPTERIQKKTEVWYVPMSSLSSADMTIDRSIIERRLEHTAIKFKNGDVLFARITPCLENGKTGFVNFLNENEYACGSTEFIVLRGRKVSPYFTYCLARTYDFRENAIKSMIGSSGRQRVQTSCFNDFFLPLPAEVMLNQFDESVSPCFSQIQILCRQNESLSRSRDLLLPRLMNGEIEV